MTVKKHIPNFLTSMNLLCGCIAIVFTAKNELEFASYMVLIGMFFDFTDGMAARLLNVKSDIGIQLDSLSDMITFGVAPSFIIFRFINLNNNSVWFSDLITFLSYSAFLIAIFSALRLAKFNIDTRQTDGFIGLPTPANALFFISFPLFTDYNNHVPEILSKPYFLIILAIIFSYLLISPIKMFSLKFKNLTWNDNKIRYTFVIISLLLFALITYLALPLIVLLYIFMSLLTSKNKHQAAN